ncbi:hypothetical protein KW850_09540 [Bacillus sp. sid0103]|nr:hypothetical protein [Bacillus sp. sid0103]MBV7505497.1 hypothetical protein [Bacillus sp. sid0103]
MCKGEKLVQFNDVGSLIKSYGNLFYMIKVDYQELTDEEQWEVISKSFKY